MLLSKVVVGTGDELLLLLLLLRWQRLRHVLLLMIGWLEVLLLLRLRLVGKVRMVTLWGGRVQHKVPVALVQMRLLRRILLLRLEVLIRTQRLMLLLLLLLGWWLGLALRGISPIAPIVSPAIVVVVVVKCGCRREWFSHFGRMVLSTSGRRRMLLTFRW